MSLNKYFTYVYIYLIFSKYVKRALVESFVVPPQGPVTQTMLDRNEVMAHIPTAQNIE